VLSGGASRHASVTDSFDRESFNSVEQTFTVVVVSFMVAPAEDTENLTFPRITRISADWSFYNLRPSVVKKRLGSNGSGLEPQITQRARINPNANL